MTKLGFVLKDYKHITTLNVDLNKPLILIIIY